MINIETSYQSRIVPLIAGLRDNLSLANCVRIKERNSAPVFVPRNRYCRQRGSVFLQRTSSERNGNRPTGGPIVFCAARKQRSVLVSLLCAALHFALIHAGAAQPLDPEPPPPDAPHSQLPARPKPPEPGPCQAGRSIASSAQAATTGAAAGAGNAAAGGNPQTAVQTKPCPPLTPLINWYARFLTGPQVKPLTPKEKGWLAIRNVLDPFNAVTILGNSAIAVGSDANSPYGPGMTGFGKNVGVSYTEDITGEFVGTFLVASLVHQDPHYHRVPKSTIKRRIFHCIDQVVWTQGDNGRPMVNWEGVLGFPIEDEIANLYVPGRQTDLPASAERYATALATAPADNFITEFLPDVASHIHLRVVLVQRVIDMVARTEGAGTQ